MHVASVYFVILHKIYMWFYINDIGPPGAFVCIFRCILRNIHADWLRVFIDLFKGSILPTRGESVFVISKRVLKSKKTGKYHSMSWKKKGKEDNTYDILEHVIALKQ